MTEYYTTSSLTMAAAAVEQGFAGIQTLTGNAKPSYKEVRYWQDGCKWRFPKTPHNVGLMNVFANDWIYIAAWDEAELERVGMKDDIHVKRVRLPEICIVNDADTALVFQAIATGHIIYRNNKPFPVWDEEGA